MRVLLLGMAFLLGTAVPAGSRLVSFLGLKKVFTGIGGAMLGQLTVYVVTYGLAFLVVALVARLLRLSDRLPEKPPGRYLICAGLLIVGVYMGLKVLAIAIPGGGASFALALNSLSFLIPGGVLTTWGVARTLWAAYRTPKAQSVSPATDEALSASQRTRHNMAQLGYALVFILLAALFAPSAVLMTVGLLAAFF